MYEIKREKLNCDDLQAALRFYMRGRPKGPWYVDSIIHLLKNSYFVEDFGKEEFDNVLKKTLNEYFPELGVRIDDKNSEIFYHKTRKNDTI